MDAQSGVAGRDFSNSPPRRIPTGLKISSFLPFARPPPVASPVKRKPLPPNAVTPVSPKSKQSPNPQSLSAGVLPSRTAENLSSELVVRNLDQFPRGTTPTVPTRPGLAATEPVPQPASQPTTDTTAAKDDKKETRAVAGAASTLPLAAEESDNSRLSNKMAAPAVQAPQRPNLLIRSFTTSSMDASQPKTPGSKITTFFGWKNSSPSADSSSTEISEGRSALPSPNLPSPVTTSYSQSRSHPPAIDISRANAAMMPDAVYTPAFLVPAPSSDGDLAAKIGLLESELKEISAELASSIKREMDLEDMVETLQLDGNQGPVVNNRTSDYYSDSSSSGRNVPSSRKEDIELVKRRSEQERAQLKVSLSQKWQDERSKRKALESHVSLLEEQLSQSRADKAEVSSLSSRAKELESALDDARRRLAEERQIKENFEDLLTALRVDLEQHRHERDNLRDEVIPQLQAQLESVGPTSSSKFDPERMHQEIQALKKENASLIASRKIQQEMQSAPRFSPIMEEGALPSSPIGLTRSNSLARMPARNHSRSGSRSGSLSRSNSLSGRNQESRESLIERVKDVEAQRDALHQAVKNLLERQAHQAKENQKRVKMLEMERDRAMGNSSPRRQGYEKEVKALREEVNQLRRRADDALEQKWQCEKGLGGLRKDLERAEQETSSLRSLLNENDISVPEHISTSLQAAYSMLQRDREQVVAQQDTARSLEEERRLAEQLRESAERQEALASQVRQQLYTNQNLRDRLAEAVSRGETSQQTSAARITELQSKLKRLEDTVMVAQSQSETAVMRHEEDLRILRESHKNQLQRAKAGFRTPNMLSPMPSPVFAQRSPRLAQTSSGPAIPLSEAMKVESLEKKVQELEKALQGADKEMGEVVGKMNMAQIEVFELQSERDEALRRTRKLQAEILAEREKMQALMSVEAATATAAA